VAGRRLRFVGQLAAAASGSRFQVTSRPVGLALIEPGPHLVALARTGAKLEQGVIVERTNAQDKEVAA
jgi:hypothetical protein